MRIGIDLGGTKIEGIALDGGGQERARLRVATPRGDYEGRLRAVGSGVSALERESGAAGSVGIGIPGAPSPSTGLIRNANSTWLNGRPLAADLARALGRPVRLANDANCFALSESKTKKKLSHFLKVLTPTSHTSTSLRPLPKTAITHKKRRSWIFMTKSDPVSQPY